MKDLQYITHDLGARNDPKLMDLQMEMGGQGLAIFWCLVEMLWENDGSIPANYKSIAFALRWCKPAEVEKVVTGFGLFQVEDGNIVSRSASERIAKKKELIQGASERGRKAIEARWNRARNTDEIQPKNGSNTPVIPRNIDINKDINKERDNNTAPLTAADLFEIFFFENMKDPSGEAKRFIDYYAGRGWTYLDGTPVSDPYRAAVDWKPKVPGQRFPADALNWYHAVWNAFLGTVSDDGLAGPARKTFLHSLDALRLSGQKLSLTFRTAEAGQHVARFILDNDLAGDWQLDFRVAN